MSSHISARKLAVVVHADVVGSTNLVHRHEQLAHDRIRGAFERFSECIGLYGGTTHEIRGDALLASYERASDAVTAALAFQTANAEHNKSLDDDIRPEIRIGISLGEVVIADGTLTGPDVVLAQRLEQLAEPGGVCISMAVRHALPERLPFDYVDLEEQDVKGFGNPVRAFAVLLRTGEDVPATETPTRLARSVALARRHFAVATFIAVALIVAGGAFWLYPQTPDADAKSSEGMPIEKTAANPDGHPSIAVLAFDNLSGDPEQNYFGDGLAENIITRLHKLTTLFVIARNSSFHYKGKQVNIQQVGRELGVRYVLEGSVQKAGRQIRIHAQLIDAQTGKHLWAESYDRDLDNLFAVQDEITRNVVSEMQVTLTEGEQVRYQLEGTDNPEAQDLLWRGVHEQRKYTRESNIIAHRYIDQALALDPDYVDAIAVSGWSHLFDSRFGWTKDPQASFRKAEELAALALRTDPNNGRVYALLQRLATRTGRYEDAIAAGRRMMELTPNSPNNMMIFAWTLLFAGETEASLATINEALALAPHPPINYPWCAGYANTLLDRPDEANVHFHKLLARTHKGPLARTSWGFLVANLMALGEEAKAGEQTRLLLAEIPGYSVQRFIEDNKRFSFKDFAFLERFAGLLRNAGLPEA